MLKVGPWVAGRLLLFDLGFFSYGLFARLSAHGGYFVSRLKACANPTIVAVHRVHRGRTRELVGKPLAEVLPRPSLPQDQREGLDVEVELSFKRRRYRGRRRTDTLRLRLVGLREATPEVAKDGEYHLYLTNIPPKKLPAEDLGRTYALRWVIEVFVQDWKTYEGWGALTKQPGEEGSSRSLILSLLVDHCLLLHPAQLAQLNHRQPAYTVGSLIQRIKVDSLLTVIRELLDAKDPEQHFQRLADTLAQHFSLAHSEKHLVGRDLGRLEPTPALKYKAAA